jgi:hypothetical protein
MGKKAVDSASMASRRGLNDYVRRTPQKNNLKIPPDKKD